LQAKRIGFVPAWIVRGQLDERLGKHRKEFVANGFLATEKTTELWRISARVGALNDIDYGLFIGDIKARVEPVLAAERERLARTAPAAAAKKGEVLDPKLAQTGWGVNATYTGLVPLVYKAQRSMLNGLVQNFMFDLLTVTAVVTIMFVDLAAAAVIFLPSVFPLVIVFGLMGWLGITVDVGTVMAPVVALGVSVDDAMHYLMKYRSGLKKGLTRKQATMLAYENSARAMYQSWSVLGLGLAVFALSRFVPTQRFGMLMFTMLSAALVGNLLLLPATLNSPIGWLFGLRMRRRAAARKAAAGAAVDADAAQSLAGPNGPSRRDAPHRRVSS
jgi:hypothetical protein